MEGELKLIVDGSDDFSLGVDSFSLPSKLVNGEYEMAMNVINRGGILQTRPGSKALFNVPDAKLQGITLFTPQSGIPHLVFAIGGLIYASAAPFKTYSQITGLTFGANSRFVAWASCIQTTYYDALGELQFLDKPKPLLIIQDGATRAGYWDGNKNGQHINPTRSTTGVTSDDTDGTLIGLWMAWSNNRLWVSRDNMVFASDIGNPLKFTETQYINEGRAFYLPGYCTGIVETPMRDGIICFSESSADFIQSSIQDRTKWLDTAGFQRTAFANVGCVAPRSIVNQYGLVWWYTSKGLISMNDALLANVSSRLDVQDNEMYQSKHGLSADLSSVCGSFIENVLFEAVPYGEKGNSRVHVLDQAPFEDGGPANSWASYWEGWKPIEFARGVVNTQERIFCLSDDDDGTPRIWELFLPDKTDNGVPITSYVITRQHTFDNMEWKRFKYAELEFRNIEGATAVMVAAMGVKGGYDPVLRKDLSVTGGQIYYEEDYGVSPAHDLAGSTAQSRIMRTNDMPDPQSVCTSTCIESNKRGLVDKAFSMLVMWSGIAGLTAYRIFAIEEPDDRQGACEVDETGEDRLRTPLGCGVESKFSTDDPLTTYYSTQAYTADAVTLNATQSSQIHQQDAIRKAQKMAEWKVLYQLGKL